MQQIKAALRPGGASRSSRTASAAPSSSTRSRRIGTPNIAAPSFAQCRGPRDVGFTLTFGEEVGSPERTDIRNARCLVLIGSHLGENMHNTQVQEFAEAIGAGASIIVVDPRFSIAASKAKHYLPIKPGTDLALLLAWMHVIVAEGLYDKEYVAAHGFGFDAFTAEIAAVHARVGLPGDRHRAGGDPRDGARDGALPAGHARSSRAPRDLVRRRHAAEPGDRAAERAARQLGPEGRVLDAGAAWTCPATRTRPTRRRRKGKVDNPGGKYPFANEAITTGIREATHHRAAVSGQGLDGLRDEPDPRAARTRRRRSGPSRRSTCSSSSTSFRARLPAGPTSCCRRRRISSGTTI